MGVVYEARHCISGRRVALKWVKPAEAHDAIIARFVREARAMGRIEHPNAVGVFDVGTVDGAGFLVMEYLRGESLRDLMAREGPLSVPRALELLLPAMEGVCAAHKAGVLHRDLKPENLYVARRSGAEPTTRVLDFGVSQIDPTLLEGKDARLTATGNVVGTPAYMAPEQVRSEPMDGRTDVWALGVILYEMVAGTLPFTAQSYGALLVEIAVEEPAALSQRELDFPAGFEDVLMRALEKEPADRFQSVADLARALESFCDAYHFSEPAPPSLRPPAPAQPSPSEPVDKDELKWEVAANPQSAQRQAPSQFPTEVGKAAATPSVTADKTSPGQRGSFRWPYLVGALGLATAAVALTVAASSEPGGPAPVHAESGSVETTGAAPTPANEEPRAAPATDDRSVRAAAGAAPPTTEPLRTQPPTTAEAPTAEPHAPRSRRDSDPEASPTKERRRARGTRRGITQPHATTQSRPSRLTSEQSGRDQPPESTEMTASAMGRSGTLSRDEF